MEGAASNYNINMLYFFVAVFVCLFVSDDFRSGYAKNLFTVRSKKSDYVISKTLVGQEEKVDLKLVSLPIMR